MKPQSYSTFLLIVPLVVWGLGLTADTPAEDLDVGEGEVLRRERRREDLPAFGEPYRTRETERGEKREVVGVV